MPMRHSALAITTALAACLLLQGCGDTSHASAASDHGGKQVPVPVVHVDDLPAKAEIAALFDEWNMTLRTGSPHDMAALYADYGVLLPTVSNDVRSNRAEIAEYFEHFQQLKPRGTINEQHIEVLDRNTAVNSGVYTFDVVRDGRAEFVVARYSFIYEKINGKWLIVSHHSSAMPQPVLERPMALSALMGQTAAKAEPEPTTAGPGKAGGEAHGEAAEGAHGGAHGEAKPAQAALGDGHAKADAHGAH